MKDEEISSRHFDLNRIFAFLYILKVVSEYPKFEKFLSPLAEVSKREIFKGFLFLIKVIQRCLMEALSRSWSLNLEEDITLHRAINRGVHVSKVKNTCQKTVFLKNLHLIFRKCWRSRNAEDLQRNLIEVEDKIIKPMEHILKDHLQLAEKFQKYTKLEIVKALAIFYTFIFLNDTQNGFPKGYFCSLLRDNLSGKYLSDVFHGYVLGLQFLWKNLLGDGYYGFPVAHLDKSKNWHELDRFFREIQTKIIEPLENEFKCNFSFDEFFFITRPISPQNEFRDMFLIQPKETPLSQEEDLQQTLFWYPVQALVGSYIFNGVPAFVTTLVGSVELKRRLGIAERSFVVRFVHPEKDVNGNRYSYGILIEAFGTLADHSGWLIFFDCCTDYSGFGDSERTIAEFFIERYEKSGQIEVVEYKISKETFANYLSVYSIGMGDFVHPLVSKVPSGENVKKEMKILQELSLDSMLSRLRDDLGISKGYLLELLAYWYYTSKEYMTEWRFKNNKIGEVDILAMDTNNVLIVTSCMVTFNSEKLKKLEECAMKIIKNKKALPRKFQSFKEIRKVIFTSRDFRPDLKRKILQKGIFIHTLDKLFREDPLFSRIKKRELDKIFVAKGKSDLSFWFD